MGMGYASAYVDAIEEKSIQKFCKKEYDAFWEHIKKCDVDPEQL